jgi:hypothetical protein
MGTLATEAAAGIPTETEIANWFGERHDAVPKGTEFVLIASTKPDRWIIETKDGNRRFALIRAADANASGTHASGTKTSVTAAWNVCQWDNWYDYAGSYWTTPRKGVDRGEANRLLYFFNISLGHYGLFSLTPIWLLVPFGLSSRLREPQGQYRFLLAATIALVTIVCIAFYVSRPEIDRNYGGVSSSFRWMLWLTPLWIWSIIPAAERMMQSVWGRFAIFSFFIASVFSAATALDNPWQHPWIYRYLSFLGWLDT